MSSAHLIIFTANFECWKCNPTSYTKRSFNTWFYQLILLNNKFILLLNEITKFQHNFHSPICGFDYLLLNVHYCDSSHQNLPVFGFKVDVAKFQIFLPHFESVRLISISALEFSFKLLLLWLKFQCKICSGKYFSKVGSVWNLP